MKIETLDLVSTIRAEIAERGGAILKALPGVQEVSFFDSPPSLHVRIDDTAPARAELIALLAMVGVPVKTERSTHANGSCCGACGG